MKLSEVDKSFYRGFAAAIGTVAREFNEPSFAASIARANGITLASLRAAGTESFDLDAFRHELVKRERKRSRR